MRTRNTRKTAETHKRPFIRVFRVVLMFFVCFVFGTSCFLFVYPLPEAPSFEQVRKSYVKSDGVLLDRNGGIIHELRVDRSSRRLDWIPPGDVSPALISAVIASEDHRFFSHSGIDWISLANAGWSAVTSARVRGASTITMQLAARLMPKLQPDREHRSLSQKIAQIRAARAFEKSWSKSEILEAYLNLVAFRGELQGIAAASRGLFSKEPQGLNDPESLILAALIRSPNARIDTLSRRVLDLASKLKIQLSSRQTEALVLQALSGPYVIRPQVALAPHVARRLFAETGQDGRRPLRLSCTLDGRLQALACELLRRHVLSVSSQNMHDGSALVVDNQSGEVLAYVGNIGDQSSARFVDGVQAMRQAGSTLKPFLYAMAFQKRLLTPASLIEDSPIDIPVSGGVYRPRNYDNLFHGTVTARIALASSLNVPAVKTLALVGVDEFRDMLAGMEFRELRASDFYGPSLALGSVDVTLWDLVNAYRTLANGGIWSPLRLTPDGTAPPKKRIFSAQASFLAADILSDRESRSRTFSLENPLATRFWTAVKTGTSKDMRDNWCVGFSDRYTVGVWTGNFAGDPMWDVSGITGAAPAWIELMKWLHRNRTSLSPQPPPGLVRQTVRIAAIGASKQEWFIRGTEESSVIPAGTESDPRIAYPAPGSVVALDPDIPPEDQRVFFEARPGGSGLEWILDGRSLGPAAGLTPWSPQRGKHTLKLLDGTQRELDSVSFEVRGNI